jgi:Zn-dependent peptidase ImmA (M78 family)
MSGPEDHANSLLRRLGITEPPIPVEELAEGVDALIVRNNFDGPESGFTLRDGERIIIGINTRTSRKRQRFSIAHEIGHVVLHPLNTLIVDHSVRMDWRDDVSSLGTNKQEIEANAFAAALLMPQGMIINRVKGYTSHVSSRDELIADLARVFDVSTEAMGFRLINLGILAPLTSRIRDAGRRATITLVVCPELSMAYAP